MSESEGIKLHNSPTLNQTAGVVAPYSFDISSLLDEMAEIMYSNNGIGLAANQVGLLARVIVMHAGKHKIELINPVIVRRSGKRSGRIEGCLSYPGKKAVVMRHPRITIKGLDRGWKEVSYNLKGIEAICAQHEVDHLNGVTIA